MHTPHSTTITIRQAFQHDLAALRHISIQTFCDTFETFNTPENMAMYLAEAFSETALLQELKNPDCRFFFAESNHHIIGYLKLNTGINQTAQSGGAAIEIERIYVVASFHGKNAGLILLEKALETARNMQRDYVWLGVWEHNKRAIRFYEKNGFEVFGSHSFQLGLDVQRDILMKRKLFR